MSPSEYSSSVFDLRSVQQDPGVGVAKVEYFSPLGYTTENFQIALHMIGYTSNISSRSRATGHACFCKHTYTYTNHVLYTRDMRHLLAHIYTF